jgi:hypothetical protein
MKYFGYFFKSNGKQTNAQTSGGRAFEAKSKCKGPGAEIGRTQGQQ